MSEAINRELLFSGFLWSCDVFADRPAVEVEGVRYTYDLLRRKATAIAATLRREDKKDGPSLTALFASRSITAFSGVLGILKRGHGYVPLNPSFPSERNRVILTTANCNALVVGSECVFKLEELLTGLQRSLTLVLPESDNVQMMAERWPQHRFIGKRELAAAMDWSPPTSSADDIAYLLFTSGSTGKPKGVMVAHRNVRHFIKTVVERYQIDERDRFSQNFDLTFDLSAFDMFVAWERGACVCCPPQKALMKPDRFVQDSKLTVWFSVPSTAIFMKKLGALKPNRYPTLRWSLFCGEPLPAKIAESWAAAAPNSILENLYGPTEVTIACTAYRWNRETSPQESKYGWVPIGSPLPGLRSLVVDEELQEVPPGNEGELLMSGPQVTLGYWQDEERTNEAFIRIADGSIYYKTGDRVLTPMNGEPLRYLGRSDQQVKVQGHRVELGEIEAAVRDICGENLVAALGWPVTSVGVRGIIVFIGNESVDVTSLKRELDGRLPSYMVPQEILLLDRFPLNPNGKVDRKALQRRLEKTAETSFQ